MNDGPDVPRPLSEDCQASAVPSVAYVLQRQAHIERNTLAAVKARLVSRTALAVAMRPCDPNFDTQVMGLSVAVAVVDEMMQQASCAAADAGSADAYSDPACAYSEESLDE